MSIAPPPRVEQTPSKQSAALAGRFASEYLHALAPDEDFTAQSFFDRFPDCSRFKSVILEMTLEEYVRRSSAGEQLAPAEIAGQFPAWRTAIARQIEVYQVLQESSDLDAGTGWPEPGEQFLGLELQELLGVGAFSKVYLASEQQLGNRQVVVKICRGAGEEPAFLGRLGHPHITPIHWHRVCTQTGLSAIVMPYLSRSTMADVIDRCFSEGARPKRAADLGDAIAELHPDPEMTVQRGAFAGTFADGALRWARQLADALAFAHRHHVCHSDIKPSNVLMTPAGNAVLLDFSMANDLTIDKKTIGGTFPYMAPEQLKAFLLGRDIPASFASDLFSLGVTLYEFLTGLPPFGYPPADASRHGTAQWLLERQQQDVIPVSRINPQVPESLSTTVMECLALDPQCRPESARALSARLKRLDSIPRRILNICRRKGTRLAVCASIIVLASLTVVFAMVRPPYHERQIERGGVLLQEWSALLLAGESVTAEERLTEAIQCLDRGIAGLPEERTPYAAEALIVRGQAFMASGNFNRAKDDFLEAMTMQPVDPRCMAAVAYCDARMAFNSPDPAASVHVSRVGFERAILEGMHSSALRFNLAYLKFWLAFNTKPDDNARPDDNRPTFTADDVIAEIDNLPGELGDNPHFHLLRVRFNRQVGIDSTSRIDTRPVDEAVRRFSNDPRVLSEAAFAYAWNAGVREDRESRQDYLKRQDSLSKCREFWLRALENGATTADWNVLQTATRWIPESPRFPHPPAHRSQSSAPLDLLLNPLDHPFEVGPSSVRIAVTGT